MRGRTTSMHLTLSATTLLLLLLVPIGEPQVVSGATDVVIGTVTRASTNALPMEVLSGQISERYSSAVTVDGQTYTLAPNAMFADDLGNERQWDDFQREDFVLFHLHAGQIDALVMLLPR
ncbi:MAG TPA: hypothetical protein VFA38_03010 [Nitrospirales bacterium]|nr:hypothetical protein [Nitrospirales bacterium]